MRTPRLPLRCAADAGSRCARRPRAAASLAGLLALLLAIAPTVQAEGGPEAFHGFYLLSFDRYGQLLSPYERDLAIAELSANPDLERIVLVAYGWSNDAEASLGAYEELLGDIGEALRDEVQAGHTAIFGIGWDSSQTGFRKLANDLVPLPVLADAVAFVPDRVLFPFSFWSKAAMADRIGYGGLRQTLNQILGEAYPAGRRHPDIYLVAHSFGTRILAGLVRDRVGLFPAGAEPFRSLPYVRGALWMQPAIAVPSLPLDVPFPALVTLSEHDHANGYVFPLGNLLVNAFSFTTFEALIQKRLFSAVEGTVDTARDRVRDAGSAILRRVPLGAPAPEEEPADDASTSDGNVTAGDGPVPLSTRAYLATRRTSGELISIPVAAAFTFAITPFQYVYTQWRGLSERPVDHVMDSLAQLPVVEVGVGLAGEALGRSVPWGRTGKGFFSLGALHESGGRMVAPSLFQPQTPKPFAYRVLHDPSALAPCGLPRCAGTQFVDVSDDVAGGLFGDLRNPWVGYTVGWFDLVGMHSSYRNPQMAFLLERVMAAGSSAGAGPAPVAEAGAAP